MEHVAASGTQTEAQEQYERVLQDARQGSRVRWRLDAGNAGLLSKLLPTLRDHGVSTIEVELAAEDRSETCTDIADEEALAGLVRHLQKRAGDTQLRYVLSTGRAYVPPPPALDLSTTTRCNLACPMCGSRDLPPAADALAPAELLGLIDQAAQWGVLRVALTGAGEPLADPHMLQYVGHAAQRGLRATLTTNGTPVTEPVAQRLASSAISISVSIHGASSAVHDGLVGVKGAWSRAWQAIRWLVQARDQARTGMTVCVSSVIQRANLDEVAALVRRSREEGCDGHNLQPVNVQQGVMRGGEIERRDDPERTRISWPAAEDRGRVNALFDELEREWEAHPGYMRAAPSRLAAMRSHFHDSSRRPADEPCGAGSRFLGVSHRGQIRPCYRAAWVLGSVRELGLRQLWNAKAYARIRQQMQQCPLTCLNNCFFRGREPTR